MDCYIQVSWKVSQPAALKICLGVGGWHREVSPVSGHYGKQEQERKTKIMQCLQGVGLEWGAGHEFRIKAANEKKGVITVLI